MAPCYPLVNLETRTTMFTLFTPSSSTFLSSAKTLSRPFSSPSPLRLKAVPSVTSSLEPSNNTNSAPSLPPKVQTFWQWLRDEGVVSAKTPAAPAVVPEGLGLVATRNLARNDVVLEVPKRLWIYPDAAAASEIGRVCAGLKPWVSVALFLIREKLKGDSKWRYYLDILPQRTDSTVYWSDEELAELQGTQLLSSTLSVKESRAFSRLRGQNLVLVPLADFINHSPSITTEDHAWEVTGAAGLFSWDSLFSLRTPVSVKAGEQIMIQYGINKSNADLALDYGFIELNADRNAYAVTLEIPETDPFLGYKLNIAESNGLGKTACFDIVLGHPLPLAMLAYLRLLALGGTDAFLLEPFFRNSVWGLLQLPVSRANEELICRVVRDACKYAFSGYPTTLEEDYEKLKESNLSPRLKISVGIRQGEKMLLQQIDRIFQEKELELDQLEYYEERRLKELDQCREDVKSSSHSSSC
ncbi:ribulose-1,5 bisphosphate carboxylase/oxygenase large subunit N-methyltransferase, chloroplastic-like isoform X2 [Malania oleifera]|uniref:ribulose-1,5 bisphosphate carboxylase/oxygenase large subunit N-methyltransferase, chloroplastic-like isoform X2 n=1 Tax=Malania oleifera TaxID=397392 RepID=UPI0025AEC043|nr:ribulose-1,5 bisphosphate carboxylase/oxygenase large subunit N-methyltransferase, chloroplastic-like isoform X2 [Malania oleifera]